MNWRDHLALPILGGVSGGIAAIFVAALIGPNALELALPILGAAGAHCMNTSL